MVECFCGELVCAVVTSQGPSFTYRDEGPVIPVLEVNILFSSICTQLRNCNSQLPTVELTDHQPRESTHEHLNDPLKVFNHIQNLANAIALMDSRLKEKEEALQSSQAEVKCLKIRVKQLEDELQEHSNIDARLAQLERRLGEMAAELKQSRSDRNSGNMMDYDQTTRIVMKQQIALLLQRRLQTSVSENTIGWYS